MPRQPSTAGLELLLCTLKLPGFFAHYAEVAKAAEKEGWSFETYLRQLVEIEVSERRERRIARLLRQSGLPPDKTLGTLDLSKLLVKVRLQLPRLCEGDFLAEASTSWPSGSQVEARRTCSQRSGTS